MEILLNLFRPSKESNSVSEPFTTNHDAKESHKTEEAEVDDEKKEDDRMDEGRETGEDCMARKETVKPQDSEIYEYTLTGDRFALLTGFRGDGSQPLGFIHKDLEAMEKVLKECGFEVHNPCLQDTSCNRARLFDSYLSNAREKLKSPNSCFLYYFSGHGDETGIELSQNEKAEYRDIIFHDVFPSMKIPKIYIFDTCRRNCDGVIAAYQTELPQDTLVVFACMHSAGAVGYTEFGSIFTQTLVNRLRAFCSQMSLPDIISQVICSVKSCSPGEEQNPVMWATLAGTLKLKGKLKEPPFTSKEDTIANVHRLGNGINVLVCYSPDPVSPQDRNPGQQKAKKERERQTQQLVRNLARRLEGQGFLVFTDLKIDNPNNLLKWYSNRIKQCSYVLLVCSPAFKQLCETEELKKQEEKLQQVAFDSHDKLIYRYCCNICAELNCNPDSKRFILVHLKSNNSEQEVKHLDIVPSIFSCSRLYEIDGGDGFNLDSEGGYESLVCRMAGIDQHHIKYSTKESQGGEARPNMSVSNIDAMYRLRQGYKYYDPSSEAATQKPRPTIGAACSLEGAHHPPATFPVQQQSPILQQFTLSAQPNEASLCLQLPEVPASKEVILWLCKNVVHWKFLAMYLNLDYHEVDSIEAKNPHDLEEQVYAMFSYWHQVNPNGTCQDIGLAISESKKNHHILEDFVRKVDSLNVQT